VAPGVPPLTPGSADAGSPAPLRHLLMVEHESGNVFVLVDKRVALGGLVLLGVLALLVGFFVSRRRRRRA
jgi:hypothetical protein